MSAQMNDKQFGVTTGGGHERDRLETDHGGKLMRIDDLPPAYADLREWLKPRFGLRNILVVQRPNSLRLVWYTRDNVFYVSVRLPTEGDTGYIDAVASRRCPRAGETWVRGNDLADGPYTRDTLLRVMMDAAIWDSLSLQIELGKDG